MNNENGFTLLEVLIALIILGISFSVLIQGYTEVLGSKSFNQNYNYVLEWSVDKMIEFENKVKLSTHGQFKFKGKAFVWWIEERYYEENINRLTLNVSWQGFNGKKNYSISRLILQQE